MWRAVGLQPQPPGRGGARRWSEQGGSCGLLSRAVVTVHAPKRASLHDARRHPESDARVRWVSSTEELVMSAGIMLRSFAAVLVCVLGVGQTRGETAWTAVLTQQALAAGYPGTLPPNLSIVLGFATQLKSVQVKQLLADAKHKRRNLNVRLAHHLN